MKKLLALILIIVGTVILGAGLFAFQVRPLGAMMAIVAGATCWILAWRIDRKPKVIVPEGVMPLPSADMPLEVRRESGMPIALAFFFAGLAALMSLPIVDETFGLGLQGWPFALLIGAAVGGLYAWLMLRHSPYMRIDSMGFTGPGQRLLPWREIEGVRLYGVRVKGQTHNYLQLRLVRPAQFSDRVSGLNRWRLKKQGLLHYGMKFVDTDLLVVFEAISRRMTAAHDQPVLTGFSAESKWLPWVQTHVAFGKQDNAPVWQERVNNLNRAIHGGWLQGDDSESSTLKLKLARAEKKQMESNFARLDHQLVSAVARQAGEDEIESMFASLLTGQTADSTEVAALKHQLALKAAKAKRINFIVAALAGVFVILYIWFRYLR